MSFVTLFICVLAIMNGSIAYITASRSALGPLFSTSIYLLFAFLFLFECVPPVFRWSALASPTSALPAIPQTAITLAYLALGFTASLSIYIIAVDLTRLLPHFIVASESQLSVTRLVLVLAWSAAFATVVLGWSNTRAASIYRTTIELPTLPPSFDGLTIAHLSDLHMGASADAAYISDVITKTQSMSPDLIVLTGDQTDGTLKEGEATAALLKKLHAPLGIFMVTGNHDYYVDAKAWNLFWQNSGISVLTNQNMLLKRNGDTLALGGIPDKTVLLWRPADKPDIGKTFDGVPAATFKILLSHQPTPFDEAKTHGLSLQLSGHTHGGQFFPFTLVVHLFQKYVKGLYQENGSSLYINKGTGFWGPALRTGGAGEIAFLTLKRKN